MNALSFLSQVTVVAVETPKKVVAKAAKQYQPTEADLRIWSNGAVYASAALIAEFGLEYTNRDSEAKGFGMDIIDIQEMPAIKSPERFIAISVTDRKEPKIDLFSMTRYNEDNTPVASVATQGSVTYGKETLLPLLKEVYGIEPNEEGFIDLNILREMPFTSPTGIFLFPKTVSRGDKKGETSYVRRENQTVYALLAVTPEPADTITEELPIAAGAPVEETVTAPAEEESPFEFNMTGSEDHQAVLIEDAPDMEETVEDPNTGETPVFTPVTATPRVK